MSKSVGEMESYRSESKEKLLFDCINEVLLEILGPFFNPCPWVKLTKWKHQQYMPVGNQLLEVMWRKLSYYLYQQSDMEYTHAITHASVVGNLKPGKPICCKYWTTFVFMGPFLLHEILSIKPATHWGHGNGAGFLVEVIREKRS